jgi:hypothetical protein
MRKKNGRREEGGDFSYAPRVPSAIQIDALSEKTEHVADGKSFCL